MTAIGFAMFLVGWILVRQFGVPYEAFDLWNMADRVGIGMIIIGFFLMNIGVFLKLWEVMP